jgi:hypothetical protein
MSFQLNITPEASFGVSRPMSHRFFKDGEFRSNWIEWLRVKSTIDARKELASK